jgi:hypothetical protein
MDNASGITIPVILAYGQETFSVPAKADTGGERAFHSLIYFAKYPGLPRNVLGRQGWLRNLRSSRPCAEG